MPWLVAFEAVARLGSVTDAARELDLTQGAVSRQLQKLEDAVQVPLFQRDRKRMRLTAQGNEYAARIRDSIRQIASATLELQANPGGGLLNLSILPAFGTHWLAPRLPGFLRQNPGVTLNLTTQVEPFDFAQHPAHGAIHFGKADWPDAEALKLWDEYVVPVAAPGSGLSGAGDLVDAPRLQLSSRPWAWDQWFQAQGLTASAAPAMVVDQFATMSEAVKSGLGAALMPEYLVRGDVASGALSIIPGVDRISVGAYYLVWPGANTDHPALKALRPWLLLECEGEHGRY